MSNIITHPALQQRLHHAHQVITVTWTEEGVSLEIFRTGSNLPLRVRNEAGYISQVFEGPDKARVTAGMRNELQFAPWERHRALVRLPA